MGEVSYFVCFITLLLNLRLLYIHLRIQLRRPTDSSFKLQKPLEESTYIPPSHEQSHPRSTIGGEELFGEGHRISRTTVGSPACMTVSNTRMGAEKRGTNVRSRARARRMVRHSTEAMKREGGNSVMWRGRKESLRSSDSRDYKWE